MYVCICVYMYVYICVYVCVYVSMYVLSQHAPSLCSNTTCSNCTRHTTPALYTERHDHPPISLRQPLHSLYSAMYCIVPVKQCCLQLFAVCCICMCEKCFQIQASLVIRDLTLRVFAITRFRGKKSREKIVQ